MLPTGDSLRTNDIHTERTEIEKLFHENGKRKEACVAILSSDKLEFEINFIIKTNQGII